MTRAQLEKFARDWRVRIAAREAVFVAAGVCAMCSVAVVWFRPGLLIVIAIIGFGFALALRLSRLQPWKLDAAQVARHLDRAFPQFEESSALWLRPQESLTFIERLQRRRVDQAAEGLSTAAPRPFAAPPPDLLRAPSICLAVAVALLLAVVAWRVIGQPPNVTVAASPAAQRAETKGVPTPSPPAEWPRLESAEMIVAPPAYTGRPERRVSGFNAEIEEGALVTWSVRFDRSVTEAGLRFGAGDADVLPLQAEQGGPLRATRRVTETELYGLTATMPDGALWRPHELHSLKVLKDRGPVLKILQPDAVRTQVAPPASAQAPPPQAKVEVLVSDDYAVADAHLIATVAKGTGEAVKFREQKMAFDSNEAAEAPANARRLIKIFDLRTLGLEPGDELYFYIEAADNREPSSNRARSETRFIVLKGAEQEVSTPASGVAGVNLIPQYFRSQRQIIIDTEKLIGDQPTLAESEFRNRANNLAIDQQLLRQRYGEFLGEEADHDAPAPVAAGEHEHEEHSADDGHDHGAPAARDGGAPTQQDIVAEYGHQHDSQDEATLFDRETKGTMRQALAAMWQAERFLRVAQPREALAPENRALEIIKALQQADRSYVQRVGFEAAPIDAARRLRGEVDDVPERIVAPVPNAHPDDAEAAIRDLLRMSPWSQRARPLTVSELDALRRVEPVLTTAANQEPEKSLGALEELRRLAAGETPPSSNQSELEAALLRMLPPGEAQPRRSPEFSPSLAEGYFRNLEPNR